MATTVSYPSELPMDRLLSAINVVKSGNISDAVGSLAFDLWVVQGYAQNVLLGAPAVEAHGALGVFDESDDLFVKVQKAADYLQAPSAQAVPVELIRIIAAWATQQLLALLASYLG